MFHLDFIFDGSGFIFVSFWFFVSYSFYFRSILVYFSIFVLFSIYCFFIFVYRSAEIVCKDYKDERHALWLMLVFHRPPGRK